MWTKNNVAKGTFSQSGAFKGKKCDSVGVNLVLSGQFCIFCVLNTIVKVWISSFQHTKISANMQRMSHCLSLA